MVNYLVTLGNRFKEDFCLDRVRVILRGATDGEANHVLSINEMPKHNHWVHILAKGYSGLGSDGYSNDEYSTTIWSNPQAYGGSHTNTTHVLTGQTGKDGGSQSHNNMPPYLVGYIWKRTA